MTAKKTTVPDNNYCIVAHTPNGDREIQRTATELMEIAIVLQYCEIEYSILYREDEVE